jgi:perosamine synthetase
MAKLAINGGKKVREKLFPAYNYIDHNEITAVTNVLKSGKLSQFIGCWDPDFFGGKQVREMEEHYASYFGAKHAVAVNSNTSGLICAVGAAGIGPGDEVIVSPYTMSASAASILVFNGVPVFADIEPDFFCLDPKSVEAKITPYTKAIVVVDIFGQAYNADAIRKIAKKHNLIIIEDNAQAPGALCNGKYAGTLGDMGVFSLNYHKHIHTGEGGVVLTDNDDLADRMRLIRNHAEVVIEDKGNTNLNNMLGFNFRMTEIEAAIAKEQLKKLKGLIGPRMENCKYISDQITKLPMITDPGVREGCTHVYYQQAFLFDPQKAGIARNKFIAAVAAELAPTTLKETEGVQLGSGYVKPIYLQPLYQKKQVYGNSHFPWEPPYYKGNVSYDKGICPVVESLHYETLFTNELMHPPFTKDDLNDVVNAFYKVAENINELK